MYQQATEGGPHSPSSSTSRSTLTVRQGQVGEVHVGGGQAQVCVGGCSEVGNEARVREHRALGVAGSAGPSFIGEQKSSAAQEREGRGGLRGPPRTCSR